ncbi:MULTISPECIES: hypothetical protein [unclassified Streptomyces]|uniref:hypothetical protein n=1 Tax=unclassified Streptomyces TaxID=2593676 RepID=UPI000DC7E7B2|nr:MULTISPECIES: hypothetical protein [unclassified Streptomyces]AWZ05264.1 hypothetical protein DRB89_12030 [Streptomyces sp. ICC4]
MDTKAPAALLRAAIEAVRAMPAGVGRAVAATELLGALRDGQADLRKIRADEVTELRKTLKLREIGEQLSLSTGRVDQILKGK